MEQKLLDTLEMLTIECEVTFATLYDVKVILVRSEVWNKFGFLAKIIGAADAGGHYTLEEKECKRVREHDRELSVKDGWLQLTELIKKKHQWLSYLTCVPYF